jgi:hypothetical protein
MIIIFTSSLRAFVTACVFGAAVFGLGVGVGVNLERERHS